MANIQDNLMSPDAYQEDVTKIELIQTHISWIFLTGKYVYKIKKPVNFGFLDFSTLEKRKMFCEREFSINSGFSPDIYIGVLPITSENGKMKIEGRGKIVEYCIKMRQIPQNSLMSNLLSENKIGKKDIDKIISLLIDYYEKAENGHEIDDNATFEITEYNWEENFTQTESFKNISIEEEDFCSIKNAIEAFMKKERRIFQKRIDDGRTRWCHGDLHSGNIFIENGKVYIFDAIEFNERFACSDIASDIAFLAMDLDYRGFHDLSDYFIIEFIKKSDDTEINKVIDFYKCYRAYVRGKVTSFRLNDNNISETGKLDAKKDAARYFKLAKEYADRL